MAISAARDWHIEQLDAVNAFVQGDVPNDKHVYVRYPPGRKVPSKCLKLRKSLYSLRHSAKLWLTKAVNICHELGFQECPDEPCILRRDATMILLYVDDILIVGCDISYINLVKQSLAERISIRDLGEAKHFLGISIIRDRPNRRLWLSQEQYINKIVARYHKDRAPPATTPLPQIPLSPYDGEVDVDTRSLYQQKLGSVLYASVVTRPDIAFAASNLSQFMVNPGPAHRHAAHHLLAYLRDTKYSAIKYDGNQPRQLTLLAASAAAYNDNHDHRSSAGFLFSLYGSPID